ncbi:related to putative tartrate transporter [Cephalotrichum gorgonifer]|uniref:Related to putative tartrate transporter n=1 Tax=Cephalotrichum gorgonifer TaxID=2041049 RepID=A0AAE8MRV2_9PEZI|nr:related to putative tartrate transporter [Cephalotrichum gorgonifer]
MSSIQDDIEKPYNVPAPISLSSFIRAERALIRKQDLRIIPLSAGIYFLCFLDRANIGNAKILNYSTSNDMQTELRMSDHQFALALLIFLVAYGIFEVPSNILLKKLRPSRWIAILMFSWGVCTVCLGFCKTYPQVMAVRFLLGMAEAGLFPGLVYYLTFWYKYNERSLRIALILASATLAGAFGGAIAFGIGHMNHARGLSAWRWLFIVEGVPSCLSAVLVLLFLPDFPERARWLTQQEQDLAIARLDLEGSKSGHKSMTWEDAKMTLMDWRLYVHYLVYFAGSIPFASMSLFTPSITAGLGYHDLTAQLMTVPPWCVGYVIQLLVAWSADHFNARGWHVATLAIIGALGYIVSAVLPPEAFLSRYGCLIIALSGAFSTIPPLLGWLSSNVVSTASVGLAIAINVSFGAGFGQIGGIWIYMESEKERGYPSGHWTNAAMMLVVAVGSIGLRLYYGMVNKRLIKDANGEEVRLYKL